MDRHCAANRIWVRYRTSICRLLIAMVAVPMLAAGEAGQADTSGSGLTSAGREVLIRNVCNRIEQVYPVEEIGKTTTAGLLRKFNAGEYDKIVSCEEFAARVSADLEDLSRDKHLDLIYDPVQAADIIARGKTADKQGGTSTAEIENAQWDNFGFKTIRMLEGQVGYLDLRMFFAVRYAGATACAAMDFLSNSKAVIVDLRYNGGGWDDMVTMLASYFVPPEESDVVAIIQSTLDKSYSASVLPSFVPGKRLTGIPVYLLTSSRTASAAEAFISIVTHLNASVVVVGQRTAGAENPVEMLALDGRFVLKIPCYRKVFFGGRSGWEGTGLTPSVEVPSDSAFETAYLQALHKLQTTLTGAVAQEKIQWAIDGYQAVLEPKAVGIDVLRSYAGRYRRASVIIEGENLFVQFDNQLRKRLRAISNDYFLIEDRDDLRLRFVLDGGRVVAMEKLYEDGYRSLDVKQ
jgi:retinol-binding protein 3